MAKGQMRSGREPKKPKKSVSVKAKPAAGSGFVPAEISRKLPKKS